MGVRLGLVGCGRISHAHGIAAQRIGGEVQIVACADVNEDAAKRFAATYGCDRYYTDFSRMIEDTPLDGIILVTWPAQHREHLFQAVAAGARYILCEKSLATSAQDALDVWGLAQRSGAVIVEGFMYRHHPAIARLDELFYDEGTGPLDSVRGSFHMRLPDSDSASRGWRQRTETGGGVVFDRASYAVNACARYADSPPSTVSATATVSDKNGTITRLFAQINYENGCTGLVEASNNVVFQQELQLNCERRILRMATPFTMAGDGAIYEYGAENFSHVRECRHDIKSPLPLQDDLPAFHAYQPQLARFAAVVRGEARPMPALIESVVNTCTLDALVRSGLERRVVAVALPTAVREAWAIRQVDDGD